ncbi:MAG: AAA family ATPase [Polyangiaceae bacterium]|nr:AAA family ATPase [Polyangiaceae bacterium]
MKFLTLYGLKFHPFQPDLPSEACFVLPTVDQFARRVCHATHDGGFAMVTGDPGTGKTVALRVLTERLRTLPNVVVGTIEHPQSRTGDFYRELGDHFGVSLSTHNRWGGFKALRSRWNEHIAKTLTRPVLFLDEAQETPTAVLNELRILSSKELDSKQLLCVVFAGDARLPERFRSPDLLPLGSRIRRRLHLEYASREDLRTCLEHLLAAAGNPSLMTPELKATLADHAAGNYRVLMNLADELLHSGADRNLPRLDEKLFFDVFSPPAKPKSNPRKK